MKHFVMTLLKWQTQIEEASDRAWLPPAPEAEEIDEPTPEAEPPYVLTEAQERINYHYYEDW